MTGLLEMRDKIKKLYARYAVFIIPVMKFLIAFIVINTINVRLGYMGKLDNLAIVLIVALVCSVLPDGFLVFFGALFSLLHMYQLSLEVMILGVFLYVILYLMFFRFCGKDAMIIWGESPELFERYFKKFYSIMNKNNVPFILITAWNEWGEGAYLEPDEENGFAYLEAIESVVNKWEKR